MRRIKGFLLILMLFAAVLTNCLAQAAETAGAPLLNGDELFTARDRKQTADTAGAVRLIPESGRDTVIAGEGIYLLGGTYRGTTIVIDAGDDAKVQLVLDGLKITNSDSPAVYVKSADKVFLTTAGSPSSFQVTGAYTPDGSTHLDSVIFSRSDIALNGTGSLEIVSAQGNGISTKDDMKITGGTLKVTSLKDGLEANDSIRVSGGNITINSQKDAVHSENDDDNSTGYVFISGGNLNINAGDDGIQGTTIVQIDGGTITIAQSREGIEATHVQINGGTISVNAGDDGINAASKSPGSVILEVNGGNITLIMAAGDTDAFDANGNLFIRGGTIDITARSAFDADGTALMTGGHVTVNGQVVTELKVQTFGGGGRRH